MSALSNSVAVVRPAIFKGSDGWFVGVEENGKIEPLSEFFISLDEARREMSDLFDRPDTCWHGEYGPNCAVCGV